MRVLPNIVLVCLLATSSAYAEKKVYKCTNADGSSVFSPNPCGAGAQEVKVDTTSSASSAPQWAPVSAPEAAAATPPAPAVDADDVKCRQDAERLKIYPARANLDMLLQRQAELMNSYTTNASEAVKVQIGNLDSAIAAEQTRIDEGHERADRAYAAAIAKCDARKTAHDKDAGK